MANLLQENEYEMISKTVKDEGIQCHRFLGDDSYLFKQYGRHIFDFGETVNEAMIKREYQLLELEEKSKRVLCGGRTPSSQNVKSKSPKRKINFTIFKDQRHSNHRNLSPLKPVGALANALMNEPSGYYQTANLSEINETSSQSVRMSEKYDRASRDVHVSATHQSFDFPRVNHPHDHPDRKYVTVVTEESTETLQQNDSTLNSQQRDQDRKEQEYVVLKQFSN